MVIKERISKILDKTDKPPLLTLRVYKRHIVAVIVLVALILSVYGMYFRYFMVLPQSSYNVMPKFPDSLENQRILVIAPHCDDETLGSGGLIQKAISQNSSIHITITTDCNKHKIGSIRKAESIKALGILGVGRSDVDFLDFPEVESNKKNNPAGMNLQDALDKEISGYQPTLIIAPHPEDTHIDHRSAGLAAQRLSHGKYESIKTAYYLIHYNFLKFPSPSGDKPGDYLLPPAKLITLSNKWYILDLSNDEEDKKQEAVFSYKSQLSMKNPILHNILLDFIRANELFMIENK